jgi:hypothetical protein
MRATLIISTSSMSAALLVLACATPASADDTQPHRMGDHPAVVVQRLYRSAGYDYASKFYPHPAGLRLYGAPPPERPHGATIEAADTGATAQMVQQSIVREIVAPSKGPLQGDAGHGGWGRGAGSVVRHPVQP